MISLFSYTLVFLFSLATVVSTRSALKIRSEDYMKYSSAVFAGGHMGLAECDRLFKLEPWNCLVSERNRKLPVFAKVRLPLATKETAFAHAITMAGVMYSVIKNCSLGRLENCRCQEKKSRKKVRSHSKDWYWEGCSDNVAFGDLVARHFVDTLEGRKGDELDARRAMNLHNNKVGRKIVKTTSKRICKCHGTSSACTVQTCTKKLVPFEKIGDALLKKYRSALHVRYSNDSLYDDQNKQVTKRKIKLVYFDQSPNYCKKNAKREIPGVEGRVCEATNSTEVEKCTKLCQACGLKARKIIKSRMVKCHCEFVWCCTVKCRFCEQKVTTITCVKR